jgi:hypothetical protein
VQLTVLGVSLEADGEGGEDAFEAARSYQIRPRPGKRSALAGYKVCWSNDEETAVATAHRYGRPPASRVSCLRYCRARATSSSPVRW